MSTSFFTIIEKYFQCCTKRCTCCFNVKKEERETTYDIPSGENSPFTFDDMSNPGTPGTPITWSSSSSSLESYNTPYKRNQFKPYVGIIPTNYYSD